MSDSLKSNSSKEEAVVKESITLLNSKITEIHPLAFTIEFDDQKFDENKKSKVRERLSAFALKHRRNPSLPDFREVKNDISCPPVEKVDCPVYSQPVSVFHKRLEKGGKIPEPYWKSTALKAAKNMEFKSPFSFRENLGMKKNFMKSLKIGRRYSLDDIDDIESTCQNVNLSNIDSKIENSCAIKNDDMENKSDTDSHSEAGTYTIDKDEAENDTDKTHSFEINEIKENAEYLNGMKKNNHRNWITDWVRDVEKQNLLNLAPKESLPITFSNIENANGCFRISKIPSPLNTLGRKAKPRSMKPGDGNKFNGSIFHRRSSSLSAKDFSVNHGSESNSLETASFLKTTESVVTSMQNRMKFSFERRSPDLRRIEKRHFNYKERPHPPSTASDTDTNSETDSKTFKKPIGNPFISARLNRAFSLRRAKADPEKDSNKTKPILMNNNETSATAKQGQTSKATAPKPPSSTTFSRLDCGRFSMRSTITDVRANMGNQAQKKEMKKSNGGNRSTSSLSSREVEFQNWRRRKSFDPMKAAAEGRKKELAKRAAMNQSVNLGSDSRTRTRHSPSSRGNPVLRSASFHSTAQVTGDEGEEGEVFQEQGSTDEKESASSHLSTHHSGLHNSSSQLWMQSRPPMKTPILSSRSSLVSETHSSPTRRLKSNDLEDLVLSAISEASYKLKLKSCMLLKKLHYLYDKDDEKSIRLRDEITVLESGQNFAKNLSVRQAASRDLSSILKNLKGVENVLRVLEDVLFDEHSDVYVNE